MLPSLSSVLPDSLRAACCDTRSGDTRVLGSARVLTRKEQKAAANDAIQRSRHAAKKARKTARLAAAKEKRVFETKLATTLEKSLPHIFSSFLNVEAAARRLKRHAKQVRALAAAAEKAAARETAQKERKAAKRAAKKRAAAKAAAFTAKRSLEANLGKFLPHPPSD
jgi:hypothetical protein